MIFSAVLQRLGIACLLTFFLSGGFPVAAEAAPAVVDAAHSPHVLSLIKMSSNAEKTRIVFSFDHAVPLYHKFLLGNPERFVIDFSETKLSHPLSPVVETSLVKNIRTGLGDSDKKLKTLRVVLDLKTALHAQNIAWATVPPSASNPSFRLVLDLSTAKIAEPQKAQTKTTLTNETTITKSPMSAPSKPASEKLLKESESTSPKKVTQKTTQTTTVVITPKASSEVDADDSRDETPKADATVVTKVSTTAVPKSGTTVATHVSTTATPKSGVSTQASTAATHVSTVTTPKADTTVTTKVSKTATPKVDTTETTQVSTTATPKASTTVATKTVVTHEKETPPPVVKRKLVIVIDPGHGGKDPGASGPMGTHEKDVVLAISKKLRDALNQEPGVRAVLTRSGDKFIPLRQRLQLARQAKADMFIAIHADAFPRPDASGSSVFALSASGASSEAARWLAEKENYSELGGVNLDDKGDVLRSVLIDLSQTATISLSLQLANSMLGELSHITNLHHDTVEQARFVVLKSPDIPSVLVETGFLSNPNEEKRLSNSEYQRRLAVALAGGVLHYFSQNPPPGSIFAIRHEAVTRYTVTSKDTLASIAKQHDMTAKALAAVNDISPNVTLKSGQVLYIPPQVLME